MRKLSFLFITVVLIAVMSCSKDDDFTNPANLNGTQWKSEIKYGGHYYLLKFPGKTTYELYEYEPDDAPDPLGGLEAGTYSVDESILILISDDGYTDRLKIEGNKIRWNYLFGEDEIFTKQ